MYLAVFLDSQTSPLIANRMMQNFTMRRTTVMTAIAVPVMYNTQQCWLFFLFPFYQLWFNNTKQNQWIKFTLTCCWSTKHCKRENYSTQRIWSSFQVADETRIGLSEGDKISHRWFWACKNIVRQLSPLNQWDTFSIGRCVRGLTDFITKSCGK